MANCRIINESMKSAVESIKGLAGQYANVGQTFESSFKAAIADMQGEAKDALLELFDKSYKDFVTSNESGIPGMINGMASLLEANRDNFEKVDAQIAQSIREGTK